jgi:hypothetical protein
MLIDKNEKFRSMRASHTNLEFLASISSKGTTYDEALQQVISVARPILLKQEAKRD